MIEIPEAIVLAEQCKQILTGKVVEEVLAGLSPHKFAWYVGEPGDYPKKLVGKRVQTAQAFGGHIEMELGDVFLAFSDGIQLSYLEENQKLPKKHQLLIRFTDQSVLVASVRMYGGIWCFFEGEWDNIYYQLAKKKPGPLDEGFTPAYFRALVNEKRVQKLSVKAFLATEQRIPGLGNGVLQDILYDAGIHPKQKLHALTESDKEGIYHSIHRVLSEMVEKKGRDTEKDLLDQPGGYRTKMSRKTLGTNCPKCGSQIQKASYLGGSIYYCPHCQREEIE